MLCFYVNFSSMNDSQNRVFGRRTCSILAGLRLRREQLRVYTRPVDDKCAWHSVLLPAITCVPVLWRGGLLLGLMLFSRTHVSDICSDNLNKK